MLLIGEPRKVLEQSLPSGLGLLLGASPKHSGKRETRRPFNQADYMHKEQGTRMFCSKGLGFSGKVGRWLMPGRGAAFGVHCLLLHP